MHCILSVIQDYNEKGLGNTGLIMSFKILLCFFQTLKPNITNSIKPLNGLLAHPFLGSFILPQMTHIENFVIGKMPSIQFGIYLCILSFKRKVFQENTVYFRNYY